MNPAQTRLPNPSMTWLPRDLHPVAWWGWAIGLAVVASSTTNIWMLLLVIGVAAVSYTHLTLPTTPYV